MGLLATNLLILSEVTGKAGTLWDIDLFFKYLVGPSYQHRLFGHRS